VRVSEFRVPREWSCYFTTSHSGRNPRGSTSHNRVQRGSGRVGPARHDDPRPLASRIGIPGGHLGREPTPGSPIAGTNAYIARIGINGRERPPPVPRGFLLVRGNSPVIGTFDPAPVASDVSSSPTVRHCVPTGSKISALSSDGARRKPGHRRLLQRDWQHGEVEKSLLGGELVAHSLNSSGQDRGDFG
jgi:hypothetical protein